MFTRRDFLKAGAALPLAIHSLGLHAAEKPKTPPKRIIFICNSLGFYEPYFFPKTRGDLSSSSYLQDLKVKNKATVFQNLYHPGMETSNHDSEKSFLTGAPQPESAAFVNSISLDPHLDPPASAHKSFAILDPGDGTLLITSATGKQILRFNADGEFHSSWNAAQLGISCASTLGVQSLPKKNLLLACGDYHLDSPAAARDVRRDGREDVLAPRLRFHSLRAPASDPRSWGVSRRKHVDDDPPG
jgi:hypothetical protein